MNIWEIIINSLCINLLPYVQNSFYYKQTLHNKERIDVSFFNMYIFDAPFINEN